MAKKIVIENQRGVAPEFNLWTMEAVEEMLELFPEFIWFPTLQPTGTLSAPNSFPATTALIRKNWSSFGPTPTTAKIR